MSSSVPSSQCVSVVVRVRPRRAELTLPPPPLPAHTAAVASPSPPHIPHAGATHRHNAQGGAQSAAHAHPHTPLAAIPASPQHSSMSSGTASSVRDSPSVPAPAAPRSRKNSLTIQASNLHPIHPLDHVLSSELNTPSKFGSGRRPQSSPRSAAPGGSTKPAVAEAEEPKSASELIELTEISSWGAPEPSPLPTEEGEEGSQALPRAASSTQATASASSASRVFVSPPSRPRAVSCSTLPRGFRLPPHPPPSPSTSGTSTPNPARPPFPVSPTSASSSLPNRKRPAILGVTQRSSLPASSPPPSPGLVRSRASSLLIVPPRSGGAGGGGGGSGSGSSNHLHASHTPQYRMDVFDNSISITEYAQGGATSSGASTPLTHSPPSTPQSASHLHPSPGGSIVGTPKHFTFDSVLDGDTTQDIMFDTVMHASGGGGGGATAAGQQQQAAHLLDQVLQGKNATLLAYGQTSSGKTYSVLGDMQKVQALAFSSSQSSPSSFSSASSSAELDPSLGIAPRLAHTLFSKIHSKLSSPTSDVDAIDVSVSFLEIYCEQLRDLLDPSTGGGRSASTGSLGPSPSSSSTKELKIRETYPSGIPYVTGLSIHPVTHPDHITTALARGAMRRAVGRTGMNENSSRSHIILTIYIKQRMKGVDSSTTASMLHSKIHICDLAGSERLLDAQLSTNSQAANQELAAESKKINQSLSALGLCILSLNQKQARTAQSTVGGRLKPSSSSSKTHIPFRDSALTHLLKDSLGGSSLTVMLICVSPEQRDMNQTLSSLRFGQRAKRVKNAITVNQEQGAQDLLSLVAALQKQNKMLMQQLQMLIMQGRTSNADGTAFAFPSSFPNPSLLPPDTLFASAGSLDDSSLPPSGTATPRRSSSSRLSTPARSHRGSIVMTSPSSSPSGAMRMSPTEWMKVLNHTNMQQLGVTPVSKEEIQPEEGKQKEFGEEMQTVLLPALEKYLPSSPTATSIFDSPPDSSPSSPLSPEVLAQVELAMQALHRALELHGTSSSAVSFQSKPSSLFDNSTPHVKSIAPALSTSKSRRGHRLAAGRHNEPHSPLAFPAIANKDNKEAAAVNVGCDQCTKVAGELEKLTEKLRNRLEQDEKKMGKKTAARSENASPIRTKGTPVSELKIDTSMIGRGAGAAEPVTPTQTTAASASVSASIAAVSSTVPAVPSSSLSVSASPARSTSQAPVASPFKFQSFRSFIPPAKPADPLLGTNANKFTSPTSTFSSSSSSSSSAHSSSAPPDPFQQLCSKLHKLTVSMHMPPAGSVQTPTSTPGPRPRSMSHQPVVPGSGSRYGTWSSSAASAAVNSNAAAAPVQLIDYYDLSCNRLTSSQLAQLSQILRMSPGLKILDLSENQLDVHAVPILVRMIDQHAELHTIHLHANKGQGEKKGDKKEDTEKEQAEASAASASSPSSPPPSPSSTGIDDHFVSALLSSATADPALAVRLPNLDLILSSNRITAVGYEAGISSGMLSLNTLRSMLEDNDIQPGDMDQLKRELKKVEEQYQSEQISPAAQLLSLLCLPSPSASPTAALDAESSPHTQHASAFTFLPEGESSMLDRPSLEEVWSDFQQVWKRFLNIHAPKKCFVVPPPPVSAAAPAASSASTAAPTKPRYEEATQASTRRTLFSDSSSSSDPKFVDAARALRKVQRELKLQGKELEGAHSKVRAQDKRINQLLTELCAALNQATDHTRTIAALQGQIKNLQGRLVEARDAEDAATTAVLDQARVSMEQLDSAHTSQLAEMTARAAHAMLEQQTLQEQLVAQGQELDQLHRAQATSTQEAAETIAHLQAQLEQQVARTQSERSQATRRVEEMEARLEEAQASHAKQQAEWTRFQRQLRQDYSMLQQQMQEQLQQQQEAAKPSSSQLAAPASAASPSLPRSHSHRPPHARAATHSSLSSASAPTSPTDGAALSAALQALHQQAQMGHELQMQVNTLQQTVEQLLQEKLQAVEKEQATQQELESARTSLSTVESSRDQLQAEAAQHEEDLTELERELSEAREQVREVQTELERHMRQHGEALTEKEKQIADLQSEHAVRIAEYEDQLKQLQEQHDKPLAQLVPETVAPQSQQITVQPDNSAVEQQLQQLQTDFALTQQQLAATTEELQHLKSAHAEVLIRLSSSLSALPPPYPTPQLAEERVEQKPPVQEQEQNIQQMEAQAQSSSTKHGTAQKENERLQAELQKQQQRLEDQLADKNQQLQSLLSELTETHSELARLKAVPAAESVSLVVLPDKRTGVEANELTRQQHETAMHSLQFKIDQLQQQLLEKDSQMQEQHTRMDGNEQQQTVELTRQALPATASSKAEVEQLRLQVASLQAQLVELQSSSIPQPAHLATAAPPSPSISPSTPTLLQEQLESSRDSLQAELKRIKAESNRELAEQKELLSHTQAQLSELKAQLAAAVTQSSAPAHVEEPTAVSVPEPLTSSNQLAVLSPDINSHEEKADEMQASIQSLVSQLEAKEQQLQQAQQQVTEMEKQLRQQANKLSAPPLLSPTAVPVVPPGLASATPEFSPSPSPVAALPSAEVSSLEDQLSHLKLVSPAMNGAEDLASPTPIPPNQSEQTAAEEERKQLQQINQQLAEQLSDAQRQLAALREQLDKQASVTTSPPSPSPSSTPSEPAQPSQLPEQSHPLLQAAKESHSRTPESEELTQLPTQLRSLEEQLSSTRHQNQQLHAEIARLRTEQSSLPPAVSETIAQPQHPPSSDAPTPASPAQPASDVPVEVRQEDNNELQLQLQEKQQELEEKERQLFDLRTELQQLHATHTDQLADLTSGNQQLQQQIAALEQQLIGKGAQMHTLEQRLSSQAEPKPVESQPAVVPAREESPSAASLAAELNNLRSTVAALETNLAEKQKQFAELESSRDSLQMELEELQTKSTTMLSKHKQQLEDTQTQLGKQLSEKQSEVEELQSSRDSLQSELEQLQAESTTQLSQHQQQLEEAQTRLQTMLSEKQRELELLESNRNSLQTQLEQLQIESSHQLSQQRQQLEEVHSQLEQHRIQVQELESNRSALQVELQQLQTDFNRQLAQQKQQLAEAHTQLAELRAQLAASVHSAPIIESSASTSPSVPSSAAAEEAIEPTPSSSPGLQPTAAALIQTVSHAEEQSSPLQVQLPSLETRLQEKEQQLAETRRLVEELQQQRPQSAPAITSADAQEQSSPLQAQMVALEQQLREKEQQLVEQGKLLEDLQQQQQQSAPAPSSPAAVSELLPASLTPSSEQLVTAVPAASLSSEAAPVSAASTPAAPIAQEADNQSSETITALQQELRERQQEVNDKQQKANDLQSIIDSLRTEQQQQTEQLALLRSQHAQELARLSRDAAEAVERLQAQVVALRQEAADKERVLQEAHAALTSVPTQEEDRSAAAMDDQPQQQEVSPASPSSRPVAASLPSLSAPSPSQLDSSPATAADTTVEEDPLDPPAAPPSEVVSSARLEVAELIALQHQLSEKQQQLASMQAHLSSSDSSSQERIQQLQQEVAEKEQALQAALAAVLSPPHSPSPEPHTPEDLSEDEAEQELEELRTQLQQVEEEMKRQASAATQALALQQQQEQQAIDKLKEEHSAQIQLLTAEQQGKRAAEKKQYEATIDQLQQQQRRAQEEAERQLQESEQKLLSLAATHEQLLQSHADLSAQLEKQQALYEEAQKALASQTAEWAAEKSKLQEELQAKQAALSQQEAELQQSRQRCQQLEAELSNLRAQLEALHAAHAAASAQPAPVLVDQAPMVAPSWPSRPSASPATPAPVLPPVSPPNHTPLHSHPPIPPPVVTSPPSGPLSPSSSFVFPTSASALLHRFPLAMLSPSQTFHHNVPSPLIAPPSLQQETGVQLPLSSPTLTPSSSFSRSRQRSRAQSMARPYMAAPGWEEMAEGDHESVLLPIPERRSRASGQGAEGRRENASPAASSVSFPSDTAGQEPAAASSSRSSVPPPASSSSSSWRNPFAAASASFSASALPLLPFSLQRILPQRKSNPQPPPPPSA